MTSNFVKLPLVGGFGASIFVRAEHVTAVHTNATNRTACAISILGEPPANFHNIAMPHIDVLIALNNAIDRVENGLG